MSSTALTVMANGDKACQGIYPALAGNRAVTLASHNNLVQGIRHGGFMPTTAGNPQPFGMPPYGQVLNNGEMAAVATFIRQSWGNSAIPVSTLDVVRVK
jgi:mono/diheme cytochrome c family protein